MAEFQTMVDNTQLRPERRSRSACFLCTKQGKDDRIASAVNFGRFVCQLELRIASRVRRPNEKTSPA